MGKKDKKRRDELFLLSFLFKGRLENIDAGADPDSGADSEGNDIA